MAFQKRILYMVVGGFMALALAFGAYATFAQTDEGADTTTPEVQTPETEADGTDSTLPYARPDGRSSDDALLAEALGITTDELAAAQAAARTAAIEQAVADGLLTQEQADALLAGSHGPRGFHSGSLDMQSYLADALGIPTEALQAALEEVYAARLAQMVADGRITQEQADLMQAYRSVQGYVDTDGLNAAVQSFYQAAIEAALADGVITQAQADEMLGNLADMSTRGFGMRGFEAPGFGGPGGRGHHGGHRGPGGPGSFGSGTTAPSSDTTNTSNA
ncbi:MAG: hypothetical protein KC425_17710 [Anaerolineales bacterium]|nr:hypothetical protein [Anaerolineales bacterium]